MFFPDCNSHCVFMLCQRCGGVCQSVSGGGNYISFFGWRKYERRQIFLGNMQKKKISTS